MIQKVFFIFVLIVLASACGKSSDISVAPTQHSNGDSGSINKAAVCPFVETEGRYNLVLDQLKCTLSGRSAAPDFSFVPVTYEIRSLTADSGLIEMYFINGPDGRKGKASSTQLNFPRTPSSDDTTYNGIHCGVGQLNGRDTKTLTHSCPGNISFCSYTFSQSADEFDVEMTRIVNDRTFSCSGKLEKL